MLGNNVGAALTPTIPELIPPTMTQKSTTDPPRIFEDGKLKPGIYKIQNLRSETYLDVHQHSKEVCCRPVRASDAQKWEIKPLGIGYTVQMVSLTARPGPLSDVGF